DCAGSLQHPAPDGMETPVQRTYASSAPTQKSFVARNRPPVAMRQDGEVALEDGGCSNASFCCSRITRPSPPPASTQSWNSPAEWRRMDAKPLHAEKADASAPYAFTLPPLVPSPPRTERNDNPIAR